MNYINVISPIKNQFSCYIYQEILHKDAHYKI
jgi:hypothetical protein